MKSLVQFDAGHYRDIVRKGYSYNPARRSEVAFFPAYPLVARAVSSAFGISSVDALLLVAHFCLAGAMFCFAQYLAARRHPDDVGCDANHPPSSPPAPLPSLSRRHAGEERSAAYALCAFAFLPTTFFFRMPYAEAMFVFITIAALYAIEQKWPLLWTAALVGLATAVRPVGVALLLPLAWFAMHRGGTWAARLRRVSWVLPLGCWGLLGYMAFQWAEFGEPLAFAKTQSHWRINIDHLGPVDKAMSLSSWEPFWSVYVADTPAYFGGFEDGEWIRNMRFFNPIFFAGTVVIVAIGVYRHWLTVYEILLSIGLLAIPYVTRAYEMCMASHGRFAAAVVPAYIVMGQLLARLPWWLAVAILAASAFGLAFFTSRFAGGYAYF